MWHLINRLVDNPSLCLYCIFAWFKVYERWHDDYFVYIIHVPYYTLNLVIICVRIYLLMYACIYFAWLCITGLPFFSLWCMFGYYCSLEMFTYYIDWFSYLLLHSDSSFMWLSYFPWHAYSHFSISCSYWCDWFSLLYIILFISIYCLFLLYTYLAYHILA